MDTVHRSDANSINELVDQIKFSHMAVSINYDRLLREDSQTAHIEFAIAVTQAHYRKFIDNIIKLDARMKTERDVPENMRQRAFLYAKVGAIQALDQHLPDLLNRSTAFMLAEAERTGWFRASKEAEFFTWDQLEDMLKDITDQQKPGGGGLFAWRTVVKEILPACKQAGYEPMELLAASLQARKIRQLVPAWNELKERMKTGAVSLEEGKQELHWMVSLAANPKINSSEMEAQVNKWRGRDIAQPKAIEGFKYTVPGGKMWIVIPVEDDVQMRMVEQALMGRVILKLEPLNFLIGAVARMLKVVRLRREADERAKSLSGGSTGELLSDSPGHNDQSNSGHDRGDRGNGALRTDSRNGSGRGDHLSGEPVYSDLGASRDVERVDRSV